jgi:hypothetical protein
MNTKIWECTLQRTLNEKNIDNTSRRKSVQSLESFVNFKMKFLTKYASHSHIQYVITAWACSYDNIKKVENKAITNLYGQSFRTRTKLIHNQFKILPIKEVYKTESILSSKQRLIEGGHEFGVHWRGHYWLNLPES